MAQRGIREFDSKRLLGEHFAKFSDGTVKVATKYARITPETNVESLKAANPWLSSDKLVCKPDMLFGKRGKNNLLFLNKTIDEIPAWIAEKSSQDITVGKVTDKVTNYIIDVFVPHEEDKEYYTAIRSTVDGDVIYISPKGGIFVEENWDQVVQIPVPIDANIDEMDVESKVPAAIPGEDRAKVATFVKALYKFYADLQFAYFEINPFVVQGDTIFPLDIKAKLDDTAEFECKEKWGDIEYPPSFGKKSTAEEKYIKQLDSKSGASLKLTVINPKGRVWTMVAGGGASVIYADTIVDLGYADEMATYGEYSGNPKTDETYEYAKTLLDLMTREKDPQGRDKVLLIGGGIANFTDVKNTFVGIVHALKDFAPKLRETGVKIYVRRGGPNYKAGLDMMRELGDTLGVPIEVYGPETHMTRIVKIALEGGN